MGVLKMISKHFILCVFCLFTFNLKGQEILDNLSNQPTAAYSTRLLRSDYIGPAMQIRRCSDDQLVDVYFDEAGIVSLTSPVSITGGGIATNTSLGTWVSDNSAYVMVWYDQSGNDNNATQTKTGYQPRIINAGVMESLPNGKPVLRMLNGANGGNGFNLPFNLLNATDINLFVGLRQDGNTTIGNHIFGTSGPTGVTPGKLQVYYQSANQLSMASAVSSSAIRLTFTAGNFISARFKISPDANGTGQISNSSKTATAVTGLLSTSLDGSPLTLFRTGNSVYNRNFEGVSSEVICYTSPLTITDADKILSSQNNDFVQAPPISETATQIKNNGFTANWSAPLDGVSTSSYTYTLQYSNTADFSTGNVLITDIVNNQFSRAITGLNANTLYYYRVLINISGLNGGDSGWSAVKSVTTASVLPISIMDFSAKKVNSGIFLNWKTASETNNKYFEVERSLDGVVFTSIGKVNGAGNSSSMLDYMLIDRSPAYGLNYYRLEQVDYDGKCTISNPLVLDYQLSQTKLFIYPNPAENFLNIDLGNNNEDFKIKIISMLGSVVKQFSFKDKPLDISELDAGTFIIQITSVAGELIFSGKFIKQ